MGILKVTTSNKEFDNKINLLQESESFRFRFEENVYILDCFLKGKYGGNYSVKKDDDSTLMRFMNINKITKNYIHCFDYNIFKVRSSFKLPIKEIELI
jgi:hypothetical protein